jgi:hypothetical protein
MGQPRRQDVPDSEEQLVAVSGPGGGAVPGADQQVQAARMQLGHREQGQVRDSSALAREPALFGQPRPQQIGERRQQMGRTVAAGAG